MMRTTAVLLALAVSAGAATPSKVCGGCHQAIYESYINTPMARSAGPARESVQGATFPHAASGFRYRVSRNGFEFERADGSMHGAKEFAWFVGSGATARSYLLAEDGWLFQTPVAWYAVRQTWGLAPAYETYAYPYLTRPVMPACLTCHASFLEPVQGTQNRFRDPPFREGGVACERCHGPGDAHASGGAIVNPAKLAPANRDSICAQCHLSGAVRVMAAGKGWDAFRPGERLSDSMTVFVKAGGGAGVTVTGHVEKLQQSACKRVAGDKLWCGTCHDPHRLPKAEDRAVWFRGKCLGCHAADACKESKSARAARRDDCTACHMPKNPAVDAQHVVYTDHSIPRRPRAPAATQPDADLVAFGGGAATERDLALAYAIAAPRERSVTYRTRALQMLRRVERASPTDTEVLLYLAELYRNGDQPDLAIPLYERAMRLDPAQVTASVGLGGIRMERGEFVEAIRLWEDALAKNAGLELARINLAMAYWRTGDRASAERHLVKAVELSPGFASAVEMLAKLRSSR